MTDTPRDAAGRDIDRAMAARVLDRLDLGMRIIPGEAAVLRNCLAAEQADADQARKQLADAERDHNTRRVDLAQTLGQRMDPPWPALLGSVRSVQQANTDLHGNADRYRTDRDRWKADAEQARRGEAEAVRARQAAEQQLHLIDGMRQNNLDAACAAIQRAERAEATLTAVATVAFDAEAPYSVRLSQIRNLIDPADQGAALGDPQPATTEAECDNCEHPAHAPFECTEQRDGDDCRCATEPEQPAEPECKDAQGCYRVVPCNPGCAVTSRALADAMAKAREQPAEPLLRGTPDGAALWAAIRDHAARDLNWWDAIRHRLGQW